MCLKQNTFQEQLTEAKANRKIILDSLIKQQREAKATLNKIAEVREARCASCRNSPNKFMALDIVSSLTC